MRDEVRVVDAVRAGRLPQAAELIFEYVACTEAEMAHRIPVGPADLPASLRTELGDLRAAYPTPGTVLVAQRATRPIGCVTLKPTGPTTAEVKRLYVRPGHRGGVGRALMLHLHQHAAAHEVRRLILDVLTTRRHAIDLYRTLGYTAVDTTSTTPQLLLMECTL